MMALQNERFSIRLQNVLINNDLWLNVIFRPVVTRTPFHMLESTTPSTVLVWLLPIDHAEAQLITSEGWSRFEDKLEEADWDFWDLNRPSLA